MRTHERHDLKKNELADTLEQLRQFFTVHGSKVMSIAILVLVVVAAVLYFVHNRNVARAQAWEQLLSASAGQMNSKPEDLKAIAQQTSDRKIQAFAWMKYGDALSRESLTADQPAKHKDLAGQAEQAYDKVVREYAEFPETLAGAQMGLGAIYEDTGRWDQARKIYQQIGENKQLTGTGLPAVAKSRLEDLKTWQQAAQTPLPTSQPAPTATATRPAAAAPAAQPPVKSPAPAAKAPAKKSTSAGKSKQTRLAK